MSEEPDSTTENSAGFRFRDTTRAPFNTVVRLRFDRLGGSVSADSADISMEGLFVKTEEPRPVGTLVQFEFDLDNGETVQGLGDVVWVRAQSRPGKPAGMGIQFRYVDPQSREHVYGIVSEFIRRISGSSVLGGGSSAESSEDEHEARQDEDSPGASSAASNRLSSGTVAVPLSSLPGLGTSTSSDEPRSLIEDVSDDSPDWETESEVELDQPDVSVGSGGTPAVGAGVSTPLGAGSFPTRSSDRRTDEPGAGRSGGQEVSERPRTGPFDAVLGRTERSREEPRILGSLSQSGSFSLSVPGAQLPLDGLERPTLAEPPMERAKRPGEDARGSSGLGGKAAIGRIDGLSELDGFLDEPSEFVDPTSLEGGTSRSASSSSPYGGGSGRASRSSLPWLLLVLVGLVVALIVFTKPWQMIGSSRSLVAGSEQAPGERDDLPTRSGPGAMTTGLSGSANPPGSGAEEIAFEAERSSQHTAATVVPENASDSVESTQALGLGTSGARAESTPAVTAASRPSSADASVRTPSSDIAVASRTNSGAAPVTALRGVEVREVDGVTQIRIVGNAPFATGVYTFLTLRNPPRFVLKLAGVERQIPISATSPSFVGIRSAVHQDSGTPELHLVFDLANSSIGGDARVVNGVLIITLRE